MCVEVSFLSLRGGHLGGCDVLNRFPGCVDVLPNALL